jgi:hypothetical protein
VNRSTDPSPLVDLVDGAMHDEVVRRRALRRGIADRAAASATWVGTLRDLAERRSEVTVHLAGGRVHRGRLVAVAVDHLVLADDGLMTVLIATSAVRSLRPQAGGSHAAAQGDRQPGDDRRLPEALEELLVHGIDVVVGLQDVADPVRGTADALGEDILTLTTPAGRAVLVPTRAISDITWGTR